MISRCFILCLCSLLFISCKSSFKNYKYEPISSLQQFNGTYVNYGDSLRRALGIWQGKDIMEVTLEFETPQKLTISYPTDTGVVQVSYRGEFKNNYFETYLEKKRLITIMLNIVTTNKMRIGKTNAGSMFIHRTSGHFGLLIPLFAAGEDSEYTYTHTDLSKNPEQLYPFEKNGKWGYKSSINNAVVIEPQYDFAKLFKDSIACVRLNGKWALINKSGKRLTDYKYDKIDTFYKGITKAYMGDKEGYINQQGVEIIPVIYDNIDYVDDTTISLTRLGSKYGYATPKGVLYPPVFDEAGYFNQRPQGAKYYEQLYGKVKIGGDSYFVDDKGYAYKYKSILGLDKKIIEESKIKVTDLIQQQELIKNDSDTVQDQETE